MRHLSYEIAHLEDLSAEYHIPLLDIQLMALNMYGIATNTCGGRARMKVRLDADPNNEWHVIVPTGRAFSPYELEGPVLASLTRLVFTTAHIRL